MRKKRYLFRIDQISSLIRFVFRVAIHERYFHGLALTAILGFAINSVLSEMSVSGKTEIFSHLSLSLVEVFGVIIVLTITPKLMIDSIVNRDVYILLSRPLSRTTYLTGLHVGMCFFFSFVILGLGLVVVLIQILNEVTLTQVTIVSYFSMLLSLTTLAAIAMFFSSFSSKLLSAFFTFGLYIAGNGISLILQYAEIQGGMYGQILRLVTKILPNFEGINLKMNAVYNLEWMTQEFWIAAANCLSWQILYVMAACFIFARRNLK